VRRLRAEVRNLAPGTPRVTVRPYYEGPPSMAGRGPDERGRKPAGSGRSNELRPGPEVRSRGAKSPQWSAARRARVRNTRNAERRGWKRSASRRSAPLASSEETRIRAHPAPAKEYGRRSSDKILRTMKMATNRAHKIFTSPLAGEVNRRSESEGGREGGRLLRSDSRYPPP